jgi:hypothetical protein
MSDFHTQLQALCIDVSQCRNRYDLQVAPENEAKVKALLREHQWCVTACDLSWRGHIEMRAY